MDGDKVIQNPHIEIKKILVEIKKQTIETSENFMRLANKISDECTVSKI